jgi:hypothetical protein
MSDGRNRDDQDESGAQPSDAFNYLGQPGFADKVNEQNNAREGENYSQGGEPSSGGGGSFSVHFVGPVQSNLLWSRSSNSNAHTRRNMTKT